MAMQYNSIVMQKRIASLLWIVISSTLILVLIFHPSSPLNVTNFKSLISQNFTLRDQRLNSSTAILEMVQSPSTNNISSPKPLDGGDHIEDLCDLSVGKWVEDTLGPRYNSLTCKTLHEFNCEKYGKDQNYLYWRWQPEGCELQRIQPEIFLDSFRGKRMAFVGDSLARNHMQSLQCILSQAEEPTDISNTIDYDYRVWHFSSYNFTIMRLQSRHLVLEAPSNGTTVLHIDKLSPFLADKLTDNLDYAIISYGNWFFGTRLIYENDTLIGCLNCNDPKIQRLEIPDVMRKVFRTIMQFISTRKGCEGLVTTLRTYTPSHFERGSWFDGGHCNRTRPYNESELNLEKDIAWKLRNVQVEEMERLVKEERLGKMKFGLLDVTKAMMMRADGHPGRLTPKNAEKNVNDCLHWCMPGPVDTWSDLLFATLKKNLFM